MSERKVLNKYYPPDFDPAKIPRMRREKNFSYKVRLMAPFSMRCNTCGEWIHKGKKFNARKEDAIGENYLGIQIYRFYIRCPRCSAEISFKTDPEHTDYICETGASRNFEPWRDQAKADEAEKQQKEAEEENNPMKALENRTDASKKEIQSMEALDEIRTINALKEGITLNDMIKAVVREDEGKTQEELEDEEYLKSLANNVRRLEDEEIDEENDEEQDDGGLEASKPVFFAKKGPEDLKKRTATDTLLSESTAPQKKAKTLLPMLVKKPQAKPAPAVEEKKPAAPALSGLVAYGDDDEEDDD